MTADALKPANIGARGESLWAELVKPDSSVESRVLIAEACRLVDRLDTYDAILAEDPLADGVSSEARLTAGTLQRILIGLSGGSRAVESLDDVKPAGTIADEIASRRAARQANSAG